MKKEDKTKRKILYISGTRADYGLMRQTLLAIKKHPKLKMEIIVTGMHLMPDFGKTINEIKKDNFIVSEFQYSPTPLPPSPAGEGGLPTPLNPPSQREGGRGVGDVRIHPIEVIYKNDDRESMAEFLGEFIVKLTKKAKEIEPDIILLLGDRAEMLAGAIVGAYLNIPVAHIHGGDVSSTVDELARHAITKLSHLHFAATKKSSQRIIKMGEDGWRVHLVGAPGLDSILKEKLASPLQIVKKYKLNLTEPILLVLQHPATIELKEAARQMRETMEAVKELGFQSIVLYPNADPGGRAMLRVIEKYRKEPFIQIYKTLPREDYLSLMKISSVLVGNSSSGIIEAPSFKLPVVNIGERQQSRERGCNIVDVGYNKRAIKRAIERALYAQKFREQLKKCKNPYGDGQAARRIVRVLSKIKIDKNLLSKKLTLLICKND